MESCPETYQYIKDSANKLRQCFACSSKTFVTDSFTDGDYGPVSYYHIDCCKCGIHLEYYITSEHDILNAINDWNSLTIQKINNRINTYLNIQKNKILLEYLEKLSTDYNYKDAIKKIESSLSISDLWLPKDCNEEFIAECQAISTMHSNFSYVINNHKNLLNQVSKLKKLNLSNNTIFIMD